MFKIFDVEEYGDFEMSVKPGTHCRQSRLCRFGPIHTGNNVDRIGNSQLCCRFVAGFGNSRLCRQCVPVTHPSNLCMICTSLKSADFGLSFCHRQYRSKLNLLLHSHIAALPKSQSSRHYSTLNAQKQLRKIAI